MADPVIRAGDYGTKITCRLRNASDRSPLDISDADRVELHVFDPPPYNRKKVRVMTVVSNGSGGAQAVVTYSLLSGDVEHVGRHRCHVCVYGPGATPAYIRTSKDFYIQATP